MRLFSHIVIAVVFTASVAVAQTPLTKPPAPSPATNVQPGCNSATATVPPTSTTNGSASIGTAPQQGQVISSTTTTTTEHPGSDAAGQFASAMRTANPGKGPPALPRYKPAKVKHEKVGNLPAPATPLPPGDAIPNVPGWSTTTAVVDPKAKTNPAANAAKSATAAAKPAPCPVPS